MTKKLLITIAAAVILIIAAVGAYFAYQRYYLPSQSGSTSEITPTSLSFDLRPAGDIYKAGDTVAVPVFLTGGNTDGVSAVDIKLNFNANLFKISDASPGAFFANPLKFNWNTSTGEFALSKGLDDTATPNSSSPLLTVNFKVLSASSSAGISTDPSSTVFISETGAVKPSPGSVDLILK